MTMIVSPGDRQGLLEQVGERLRRQRLAVLSEVLEPPVAAGRDGQSLG
jgi:hypothetical protein